MSNIQIVTDGLTLFTSTLDLSNMSAVQLADHFAPIVTKRVVEMVSDYSGRVMIHVDGSEHASVIYRFVAGEIEGTSTAKAW